MPRTRTGVAWWALALGGVLLIFVIIFILQNLSAATASFLVVQWRVPLGIDLLLAALLGGLVVFLLGLTRIVQLRRLARRYAGRPNTPRPANRP